MRNAAIFKQLNPQQAAAVRATEGPMLIIAGAGSGKTRVLTCRVAYLLNQGVEPWRILAITFTNKAAKEMRERVDNMSGLNAEEVELRTFHSFCAQLLHKEAEYLRDYNKNFAIYETADQRNLIKHIVKDLGFDEKKYPPNAVLTMIDYAKNAMLSPEEFASLAQDDNNFYQFEVTEIYAEYQKRLKKNNAMDFDDLLLVTVNLLTENEEVRRKYQERFRYILIDEYQDTNRVQYLLAKLLVGAEQNICVVGDADQSIYGWRGADIRNILDFEKDYPNAQIVKLEQNYRSTQNILDAANAVIVNNVERKPKNLWTNNEKGSLIYHYEADNALDEAYFVTEQIRLLSEKGYNPGDMAILYRANAQSRVLEEMLIKRGMPYVIVGGTQFYERKEIKDVLAYLKVLANPYDSLNLLRIINVPKRGIGETTLNKVDAYARKNDMHLFDVLTNPSAIPDISPGTMKKLDEFAELLFELIGDVGNLTIRALTDKILERTGMLEELENSMDFQDMSRADNLKEFLSVAEDFARSGEENTLQNFLEHIALVSDIDEAVINEDAVTLMTLHSAKSLEFKVVFMVGMEEGTFPVGSTMHNAAELEEERRLCYVGMTRAQELLYLCNARERLLYGRTQNYLPSKFLGEVPPKLIQELRKSTKVRTEMPSGATPKTDGLHRGRRKNEVVTHVEPATPKIENVPDWARKVMTGFTPAGGNATKETFNVGDKVSHVKFGNGIVTNVNQQADCQELTIDFAGEEKILLTKYAKVTKV